MTDTTSKRMTAIEVIALAEQQIAEEAPAVVDMDIPLPPTEDCTPSTSTVENPAPLIVEKPAPSIVENPAPSTEKPAPPTEKPAPSTENPGQTEEPEEDEELPKKKVLNSSDVASIYALRAEAARRRAALAGKTRQEVDLGKKSILTIEKREKRRLAVESRDRRDRISAAEREIREEEERQLLEANERLRVKAALYDRIAAGETELVNRLDEPVDLLVDFTTKRKKQDEADNLRGSSVSGSSKNFRRSPSPTYDTERQPPLVVRHQEDDEIRLYGASHMRFSRDEEKRAQEMKELLEMSERTKEERKKQRETRRAEKERERERINKTRRRYGQPEIPPDPSSEEEVEEEKPVEEPRHSLADIPLPKGAKRPKEREWDRGKGNYHQWLERERSKRDDDFAPPPAYYYNH